MPNCRIIAPVLVLLTCALSFVACDPNGHTECEPACETGLSCDTDSGECRAPRLSRFERALPGRAVRLAALGDRVYAAAIDPQAGELLVGHLGEGDPKMYVLASVTQTDRRRLAMDASESMVAVAWLAADDTYRVAVHRDGDSAERWQTLPPLTSERAEYRGSEHFDLSITNSGRIQLVFHDRRRRTLRRLNGRIDEGSWELDTVGDPSEEDDASVCSSQQRRLAGRGVGYYPDVIVHSGATFVAYQDGDCGDLRLARRIDGEWVATVVDTGDFDRDDDGTLTRGFTGQFTSIGFDSHANLAIAYQDASRGRLLVAFERDGQFLFEVADPGFELDVASRNRKHLVGGFASLIFDDDDIPRIAYLDQTTSRLRLAQRTREIDLAGTWVQKTVDAPGPTGYSASLVASETRGLVVATEHLEPHPGGLASTLQIFGEEAF